MRRISLIIFIATALALIISAYGRTLTPQANRNTQVQTTQGQVQKTERDTWLTPALRSEYVNLLKPRSGVTEIRAWARKHHFEVVHLKDYDILVPEQTPTSNPEAIGACDPKKCPTAEGYYHVNVGGTNYLQGIKCTAGSCKWVYNKELKSYTRLCGSWKCQDTGSLLSLVKPDSTLHLVSWATHSYKRQRAYHEESRYRLLLIASKEKESL